MDVSVVDSGRGSSEGYVMDVSVVVCTYTSKRLPLLIEAVDSLHRQTLPPGEILVIVDHNPTLAESLGDLLHGVVLLHNNHRRGLTGSRNTALDACRCRAVAFFDDDAVAEASWLASLVRHFADPSVMIVGGRCDSVWVTSRPRWFPREFDWVVGGTYLGMPETTSEVRNVFGNNIILRTDLARKAGGFREDMGKVGNQPVGSEETELCIRMSHRWPQAKIVYEPSAGIGHVVPEERARFRYYAARCFAEGLAKARMVSLVGSRDGLAMERRHALIQLPRSVAREVGLAVRHTDRGGLLRACSMVIGLAATAAGFALGSVWRWRSAADGQR
jgi:glycosyltransferase involved in cell wall biosynthesis